MSSPPGLRTCLGCRALDDRTALERVVLSAPSEGAAPEVVPDPLGSAHGRGAWLHPRRACRERALKTKAFARSFRRAVRTEAIQQTWDAAAAHDDGADGATPPNGRNPAPQGKRVRKPMETR